jgi:superfamily II DNA or RNA helicase
LVSNWNNTPFSILIYSYNSVETLYLNKEKKINKKIFKILFSDKKKIIILDEVQNLLNENYSKITEGMKTIISKNLIFGGTGTPYYNNINSMENLLNLFTNIKIDNDLKKLDNKIENKEDLKKFISKLDLLKNSLKLNEQLDIYFQKNNNLNTNIKILFLNLVDKKNYEKFYKNHTGIKLEKKSFKYLLYPDYDKNIYIQNKDIIIEKSSKLKILIETIKDYKNKNEKTIIVSNNSSVFRFLKLLFLKINLINEENIFILDGKTKKRNSLISSFNNNDDFKILLMNIVVGGIGFDITGSSKMIFLEVSWNSQLIQQCIARIDRKNQLKNCDIKIFVTLNSIEEEIFKVFVLKYFTSLYIFDEVKNFNFDLFSKILSKKFHEPKDNFLIYDCNLFDFFQK